MTTAAPTGAEEDALLLAEMARAAGRIALDRRAQGLTIQRKPGGSPVTDGDILVDAFLRRELLAARPGYGWLSEETPDDPARLAHDRVFIVDPVDGTSAYLKGRPWFAVALAVVEAGRPIAGVVFAPALDELYQAAEGCGALCNGRPIAVSEAGRLEGCAMLAPSGALDAARGWAEPWPPMRVEQRSALALRMALVAAGRFDAAVSIGWKNDWDIAAGDLLVREAGGRACDQRGRPLRFNGARARNAGMIACTPALQPLILRRTDRIDLPSEL